MSAKGPGMSRECIIFNVGGQVFGLDIGVIRDVRPWAPVTRVPGLPPYVVGVAHFRGAILPVIDLAVRLGWEPTVCTEDHAIVIVEFDDRRCGLVVEGGSDLLTIEQTALQQPPALGAWGASRFIEGLAPLGERMVQLLDIEALAGGDMMAALDSA
jgi:purine-binding chemotaxis protein CheW